MKLIKNLPNLSTLKLYDNAVNKDVINNFKNVKYLTLGGNDFQLIQSYIENIKTLTNLEILLIIQNEYEEKINFDSLKDLEHFTSLRLLKKHCYEANFELDDSKNISIYYNIDSDNEHECGVDNNVLNAFSLVKKLTITSMEISQDNINEISLLKDLEELNIHRCRFSDVNIDFDSLKIFNLTTLDLQGSEDYSYSQDRQVLIDQFSELEKLEYIDLSNNAIDSDIPKSFNFLNNLKYMYVI
ncbi:hypothetical protein PIROE2DRAFT_7189 [Piromyces sp. E2]|nr:hypothetical protein PIROE2DRAFT_7189 [Piromyces sp. E2]|eukprot:OUM65772.1 hypothetical protein PIROE2DRAFT_7189 [Piromyces sp. E2]